MALPRSLQRVKAPTGHVHIGMRLGCIERCQDQPKLGDMVSVHTPCRSSFVELSESTVPDPLYHLLDCNV